MIIKTAWNRLYLENSLLISQSVKEKLVPEIGAKAENSLQREPDEGKTREI